MSYRPKVQTWASRCVHLGLALSTTTPVFRNVLPIFQLGERAPNQYTVFSRFRPYDVGSQISEVDSLMAAGQVVLYFERQEDAVQFTLAASLVLSDEAPVRESALRVANQVSKATRITTEGCLNGGGKSKVRRAK
jgi:hypothetical protein